MSTKFQKLQTFSSQILDILRENGQQIDEGHDFSWPNYVYTSSSFRRAHLDIVDATESKRLYMVHLCIFPHTDDTSPIYGFDLISGPNKVTGAFHDFSKGHDPNHAMMRWFNERTRGLEWSKKRDLPDWAKNIFSESMIAAGNITDDSELDSILKLAKNTLEYYIDNVGYTRVPFDTSSAQDYYCENQRKNPHTPKVMSSLGLDPETVDLFVKSCLFPPVQESQLSSTRSRTV